jgi:uncharacterized protein
MISSNSGTQPPAAPTLSLPNDMGSARLFSLDVIRGIALLGILIVSIWQFGGFTNNRQVFYRTGTHGGNYDLLSFVTIVFEGKMRALFAMVFGAGIILFMTRKNHPSNLSVPDLYIKRNMWLLLFGIFNGVVLLWPGDILYHYAIMGILLFGFWRMSPRGLLISAILAMLIYCGKTYWNYSDDRRAYHKFMAVKKVEKKFEQDSIAKFKKDSVLGIKKDSVTPPVKDTLTPSNIKDTTAKPVKTDTLTAEQKKHKEEWEGMVKSAKFDSTADARENKAMRKNSYAKTWNYLLPRVQNRESYWLYQTGIWDIGSTMLLGMALLGFGFFGGSIPVKKYLLIAIPCLLIGLSLAIFRNCYMDLKLADYEKYIGNHALPYNFFFPIERMLLALSYAALAIVLLRINILGRIWRMLATVGRMAFTNYFLQTILCTIFFYGYGLGNFGRLSQVQLYFVVAELWLIQVVFSVLWMRYFTMGPVEWLWRWLTYGKKMPFKKTVVESSEKENTKLD